MTMQTGINWHVALRSTFRELELEMPNPICKRGGSILWHNSRRTRLALLRLPMSFSSGEPVTWTLWTEDSGGQHLVYGKEEAEQPGEEPLDQAAQAIYAWVIKECDAETIQEIAGTPDLIP